MPRNSKRYEYSLPAHKIDYGVKVTLANLKVDTNAQRSRNEQRAQGISNNLIITAVGMLTISQRANGDRYIVDGMHRARACELAGVSELPAEVHYGLDVAEEAILFLIKNKESRAPSAIDEYKVGLTAGVPLYVDIQKVLDTKGLVVGPSSASHYISAIKGVQDIMTRYGPEVLERVLNVADLAWGGIEGTWDGSLLGGLGELLGKHGDIINDQVLAEKLAKGGGPTRWLMFSTQYMVGDGNGGGAAVSKRHGAYRAFVILGWNKNRRKDKIEL